MTWQSVEPIADALLYEGYVLYPYRRSALKNQYRWQFGVVAPRDWSDAGRTDPCLQQTECLVRPRGKARLDIKVRFLQVERRQVEIAAGAPNEWQQVDSVFVGARELTTWDEAVPREIVLSALPVAESAGEVCHEFEVEGSRDIEQVADEQDEVRARIIRERLPIAGSLRISVARERAFCKVRVRIENVTPWQGACDADRPTALRRSLIATHTILAVNDGEFISLLDPPADAAAAAASCMNAHTWPVLAGAAPERNLMLSSPIVLYDYPQVAAESPGDLFDGTEIDELLTLSVLALSDDERREAHATDPRAAQLIERSHNLQNAQLARVHGALRAFGEAPREQPSLEAWLTPPGADAHEVTDAYGNRIGKGSRVRLLPRRGADAMDMFLSGQAATVAAVYLDLEDQAHVAVVVDSGNASDLHEWNGRYFYFKPEEVQALDEGNALNSPATAKASRIFVAGIGNIFLGDDGFGSAVVQRLQARALPESVRVEDIGIRSVHLAYDLLDAPYDATILIDAVARGEAPGTLYVIEPGLDDEMRAPTDAHDFDIEGVLALLNQVGARPGPIYIVGCEPLSVAPEIGLSDVVAAAVDGAADLVVDLINRIGG